MALIEKSKIDFDKILVKIRFVLKGFRQEVVINTTANECMEFVDILNENKSVIQNAVERKKFENSFYHFNDYQKKATVSVNLNEVKVMEVPFFMDAGKDYDLKILEYRR